MRQNVLDRWSDAYTTSDEQDALDQFKKREAKAQADGDGQGLRLVERLIRLVRALDHPGYPGSARL